MQLAQNLDKLMNDNNISAYKISKETGISDRLIGYWRNGDKLPGAENLLALATYFGISVDYLLTGRENSSSAVELSADEQELITYYRQLDPKSQGILLGRAETMAENRQSVTDDPPKNAPCVTTSLVYSRSTDNMPPRTVTGDFSDILNAPDATDEY